MIGLVQRLDVTDLIDRALLQVVLKIRTHTAPVDQSLDAQWGEPFVPADAGQAEDLRRADRAGRQDDRAGGADFEFLAVAQKHDAACAAVFDDQALDVDVHLELQIPARERGLQESSGRRPASTPLLVDVKIRDAFVVAAIEVIDGRYTQLHRGIPHRVEYSPGDARRLHTKFTADSVVLAFAQEMILHASESRQ